MKLSCPRTMIAAGLSLLLSQAPLHSADLANQYNWKPVRLGAGGFVTGFVIHPGNPSIRYCRTDVGNAYRWDTSVNEWVPMLVRNGTTGLPAAAAAGPARYGVESVAIDPQNPNIVLLSFPVRYSPDNGVPSIIGSVFRSTDGGRNFVQSNLNVTMTPNGTGRNKGESMGIDPNNSQIVYYGSRENGLWKSADAGLTWSQLSTGGAPATTAHVIGVRFDRVSASSTTVYAIVGGGSVLKSVDAGANWTIVSGSSTLANAPGNSVVDQLGNLFVAKSGTTKICKMTRAGVWTELSPNFGSSGNTSNLVAVDPANPNRIFAIGSGSSVSRSLDGGLTWVALGNFVTFSNTLGWLPQVVNGTSQAWRSNGGIFFDSTSRLWIAQGNEGILTTVPSANNTETASNPLRWKIDSKGIEEFVGRDVTLLPGSGDKAIVTMEDGTGFLIRNPDSYDAVEAHLANQLLNAGTSVAFCPNDSSYVVIAAGDIYNAQSGLDYSGYSNDGGLTWSGFTGKPTTTPFVEAGSIAISRRDNWGFGNDHLVWYPIGNRVPFWSHNGGQTWSMSTGFPANPTNGAFTDNTSGFWQASLKQHPLVADQLVPNRFYLYTPYGGQSRLYRSTDGGINWSAVTASNLPSGGHNCMLISNPFVLDEYWFADGQQGATTHGLWRSTNGGLSYTKLSTVDRAITVAVGKGTGPNGAIYIYGRLTAGSDWGVFRSVDAGVTWDRLSYFPAGLTDMPTSMAASRDTFGLVYISYTGNSFVYGRPGAAVPVSNAGFETEFGTGGWRIWYDSNISGNPFSRTLDEASPAGNYHGTLGGVPAYNSNAFQRITGLTNGTYTLRGLFRSGGTFSALRLLANAYDSAGSSRFSLIPVSNSYVQVTVTGIAVTNGAMTINVYAVSNNSGWLHFDQVQLTRE